MPCFDWSALIKEFPKKQVLSQTVFYGIRVKYFLPRLSVKAGMGNRGTEWRELWERGESGWKRGESGWFFVRIFVFIVLTKIPEREGSISPSSFYGQLPDYQSHVFCLVYQVDEFSFKEMSTFSCFFGSNVGILNTIMLIQIAFYHNCKPRAFKASHAFNDLLFC